MSASWNKQDWFKNILSKSGTEITKIKDVKSEGLVFCFMN